jgi:hypothetical protein
MKALWLSFALVATAVAAPLPVKNGAVVRVPSGQRAVGLQAGSDGWRIEVGYFNAGTVDVIDVTPGTPARTMRVAVDGTSIRLDPVRFAGGHVYRVQARDDDKQQLLSAYVYLYPAATAGPAQKAPTKFDFSRDE